MLTDRLTQFRFNPDEHVYTDLDGRELPHITGMLARTGWIDDTWYTEESCERGQAVHALTADFDLGVLDPATAPKTYRAWVLAYVAGMKILQPIWDSIEAPIVHPTFRFGGRPDRVGKAFGISTILEVKSNNQGWNLEKAHPIQTALQAVLVSATRPLPAEAWVRYAFYCRPNGQYRLEDHEKTKHKDFAEAYRIIRECCR